MTELQEQQLPTDSPWTFKQQLGILLWDYCWLIFCSWTPKPFFKWRLAWLRLFGARIDGSPFVHQRARIQIPWHIHLHDTACIGDRTNLYSLGEIEVLPGAIVGQECYICTGTHDLGQPSKPLVVKKIIIGKDAFIGVRAIILPGVKIGDGATVGAGAVVTKDVAAGTTVAGNPAKPIIRKTAQES